MPQDPIQAGPFTEYLTQPAYNPPQTPISGFQGAGGTAAMLVSEFLKGSSAARKRNFEQTELQRARNEQRMMQLAQYVNQMPLRREAKEQANQLILGHLFNEGRATMAEQGGKQNPLVKAFDAIIGPAPKKIDDTARLQTLNQIFDLAGDPGAKFNEQEAVKKYFDTARQLVNEQQALKQTKNIQPFRESILTDDRLKAVERDLAYQGVDVNKLRPQLNDLFLASDIPGATEAGTPARLQQSAILGTESIVSPEQRQTFQRNQLRKLGFEPEYEFGVGYDVKTGNQIAGVKRNKATGQITDIAGNPLPENISFSATAKSVPSESSQWVVVSGLSDASGRPTKYRYNKITGAKEPIGPESVQMQFRQRPLTDQEAAEMGLPAGSVIEEPVAPTFATPSGGVFQDPPRPPSPTASATAKPAPAQPPKPQMVPTQFGNRQEAEATAPSFAPKVNLPAGSRAKTIPATIPESVFESFANGTYGDAQLASAGISLKDRPRFMQEMQKRGLRVMTKSQVNDASGLGMLQTVYDTFDELNKAYKQARGGSVGAYIETINPDIANMQERSNAMLGQLARIVGAEKGVLTQRDVERAKGNMPTKWLNLIGDKQNDERMAKMRQLIEEMEAKALANLPARQREAVRQRYNIRVAKPLFDDLGIPVQVR